MKWAFILLSSIGISVNAFTQVNLQTGSAQYSIPIFSFSDAKSGLATSILLNYSSGNGLVVSDIPSSVGQNWNLVAGGSIIRLQNGEPDDQNSTSIFPTMPNGNVRGFNENIAIYDEDYQSFSYGGDPFSRNYITNYYPNGYMYSEFGLDMTDAGSAQYLAPRELAFLPRFKSNMDKNWKLSRRALTDREQDVFIYNFNGVTGQFVIGRDGNVQLINDSKIKIEKTTADMTNATPYNIRTRINSFTITDASGMLYKFSAYELANVMVTASSSEGPDNFQMITASGNPIPKYTIQKWVLTEIKNPITLEKITFGYEDYIVDQTTDRTPSYQFTEGQSSESVEVYYQRSRGILKRLSNIVLPDGHKVEFFYSNTERIDLLGDYPLTKIKISYNNSDINSYVFQYGYFLKKEIKNYTDVISQTDKRFARLCLTSFQKTGAKVPESPYTFTYYTGSETTDPKDIVPPLDCMAQDHWGFYNKTSRVDNDVAYPAKEVLKDLMLNSSTYRQPLPGAAQLGLLKDIQNPFGGKLTYEYEQNDSKDVDNPTITRVAGGVRVSKATVSDGINTSNNVVTTYSYKLSDGTTSGWGYESPTYLDRRQIRVWKASSLDGYDENGVLIYDVTTALAKLVVKEIAKQAIKIAFKAVAESAGIAAAPQPVIAIFIIITGGLIDRLFVLFDPTDYVWSDSYNFYPHEKQNPIGINYSRVELRNTSITSGSGKSVQEFSAPANVRAEIPGIAMPYSSKQRFAGWKYGLPTKTFIYNEAGTLLKETTNTYSVIANTNVTDNHKSSKVQIVQPESSGCWAATYAIPITDFSWEFYYPIIGRTELTGITEKEYSASGTLSQKDVINTYNSDFLLGTSTTTRSNGDQIIIKNYYPDDYDDISPAITDMKTFRMYAVPVSTETWLKKPNNDEFLIDATINEYVKLSDGQIKLSNIYKLESKEPVAKATVGYQVSSSLVRSSSLFKVQSTTGYNALGNPVQVSSPGGDISSKIFDYNDRFVTASVLNAGSEDIAFSSFEAVNSGGVVSQQTTTGSWVIFPGSTIATDRSLTGKYSFSGRLDKTVTHTGNYTVTIWGHSWGNVTVNGQTGTALANVGDWRLFEWKLVNVSTITVLADNVDEVRLCPTNAKMVTFTYNPAIGKTSECDESNRIVFYEYDDFGRLRMVRDENGNIVKMYEYNYKR